MALDSKDIEIIRATWLCVRQDTTSSGCLLFKELFTRHPDYLELFKSKFPNLDLEHMKEDSRLVKHAVTVINTVSFVVDSLGDEKQAPALNNALVKLVKSHLRKKIGLDKFRNLGDVLIDFICNVNHFNGQSNITKSEQVQENNITTDNSNKLNNIDTKLLRASWAKLYGIILNLVEQEEKATTSI